MAAMNKELLLSKQKIAQAFTLFDTVTASHLKAFELIISISISHRMAMDSSQRLN